MYRDPQPITCNWLKSVDCDHTQLWSLFWPWLNIKHVKYACNQGLIFYYKNQRTAIASHQKDLL